MKTNISEERGAAVRASCGLYTGQENIMSGIVSLHGDIDMLIYKTLVSK